jgi:cold shock CspA family protein
MIGTVARWDPRRGFGFLESDDTGQRIFCHISRVMSGSRDYLTPGTRVEYDEGISKRTNEPEAKNVRVVERCNVASLGEEW